MKMSTQIITLRNVVVFGTPIVVLVPRVIEIVWFRKTLTMTSMASVPMPAATPASRAIGAAVSNANAAAKPAPASVASIVPSSAGKIHDLRKPGISRYVNSLISGGIVSSADVYAPIATKATWPNESTPGVAAEHLERRGSRSAAGTSATVVCV